MGMGNKLGAAIAVGLLGAAAVTELRKPAAERTWHGKIGGWIPYDLRPPTADRYRAALWSPESDAVLSPIPFGVGWTLNFGRLARAVDRGP